MSETTPDSKIDPRAALVDLLGPVLARVSELRPRHRHDPAQVAELERDLAARFPPSSAYVQSIGATLERGISEGWLCNRGDPHARFSRVAKPSRQTHDLSVDVVSLEGEAMAHTHTLGEITLGFAAPGSAGPGPTFDGRPPGWVFLGPGSRHAPRVEGGRMTLVYFLPEGAVEWHRGD